MANSKILIPEGEELIRYLNDGYFICNKCGALMDYNSDNVQNELSCPNCGWHEDSMEYEYDYGEELDWSPNMLDMFGEDIAPSGCAACGGDYPNCKISCPMFDD